jgi:hypothetical protein
VDLTPCTEKLKAAYAYLKKYADDHKGKFPNGAWDLVPTYASDMTPFQCPVGGDGTRMYEGRASVTVDSPPDSPLLFDPADQHEGGRNVLLANGEVVFMSEEDFQKALEASTESATDAEGGAESSSAAPVETPAE